MLPRGFWSPCPALSLSPKSRRGYQGSGSPYLPKEAQDPLPFPFQKLTGSYSNSTRHPARDRVSTALAKALNQVLAFGFASTMLGLVRWGPGSLWSTQDAHRCLLMACGLPPFPTLDQAAWPLAPAVTSSPGFGSWLLSSALGMEG